MNLAKNKVVIVFAWIVGIVVAGAVFVPGIIQAFTASEEAKDLRPQLNQDIKQNNATMNDFIEKNSAPSSSEKIPN